MTPTPAVRQVCLMRPVCFNHLERLWRVPHEASRKEMLSWFSVKWSLWPLAVVGCPETETAAVWQLVRRAPPQVSGPVL